MSTDVTGTVAALAAPVPVVPSLPPLLPTDARTAELLDLNVRDLRVPLVGSTYEVPGHDIPVLVADQEGREVVWLTRTLRLLSGEGLSTTTLSAYAKCFLRAARPMWALGCEPSRLTPIEYAVVRSWLRLGLKRTEAVKGDAAGPLSTATLLQTETALATIYNAAYRIGLVAGSPIDIVRDLRSDTDEDTGRVKFDTTHKPSRTGRGRAICKLVEKEIVTLSPEDSHALRWAAKPRDRALWRLCLDSGPRISEALSITPRTYDPERNRAHVVGKGLDGATRLIPVTDFTVEAITDYLDRLASLGFRPGPDDSIFRSLKYPYAPHSYDGAWQALRRALGNRAIHPHALRHTAATELLALGDGNPAKRLLRVKTTLGHRHLTTTQRYLHTTTEEVVAEHLKARKSPRRPVASVLRETYDQDALDLLHEIRVEI